MLLDFVHASLDSGALTRSVVKDISVCQAADAGRKTAGSHRQCIEWIRPVGSGSQLTRRLGQQSKRQGQKALRCEVLWHL